MFITIYTDISGVDGKWAYSCYIKCDKGVHSDTGIISELCHDTNHAEMIAIVTGIKSALNRFKGISRILVVTDSINAQYSLWTGSKHKKYHQIIDEFRVLEEKVDKIMIKWTKGHRSDDSDRAYLNNKCDKRSREALKKK
jgi:ribonuclease HI